MNIVPRFSFNYRRKPFELSDATVTPTDYGRLYELRDGLKLELHVEEWPEYNALSWTLWFENTGTRDSGLISDVLDCDVPWCFAGGANGGASSEANGGTSASVSARDGANSGTAAPGQAAPSQAAPGQTAPNQPGPVAVFDTTGNASYESYLLAEKTVAEFSVHRKLLPRGASAEYHPGGGRSASGQMPFFDVYAPGRGLIAAIGWSGQWHASFTHLDGEVVQLRTGLEYTSFKLHPGERIRTSSILLMEYTGTQVRGGNLFRRLIKNKLCPYSPDRYPFALEGMGMPTTKHLFHLEQFRKHGVNADYYWIDAGWYGKGGAPGASDWYKQVGNWQVRPDEHPDGLKDVVRAANDAGMQLLLWMEPERAYPGTELAVDHPDWLYPLDGFYLLLRLEKDEVREYLFELICGFIDRLGIGCFRQDFNMEPLQSWRITDEMYRGGINEIKYIMNLYQLWDDLRAKYPGLVIDNCASGGRRIDIESLRRTIPVWRTDAYCEPDCDPDVIQTQMFGFNRLIPCSGGVCKKPGDTYATRSAYAPAYVGSWWWTDRPTPTEEQFNWMAKICEEYRALRPYFSCDFYPLENCGWSYAHGGWAAYRYDRPEEGDGIVMAFRRSGSTCETSRYPLEGLEPGCVYTVKDIDSGEAAEFSGAELAANGLTVTIPGQYQSRILLYRKK